MIDDDLFPLRTETVARCSRCAMVSGQERPEHRSALRCPHCDFPFGETLEAIKAIAFALQAPKRFMNVYAQPVCYVWLQVVRDGLDLDVETYMDGEDFNTKPDWLDYELGHLGWRDILSPQYRSPEVDDFTGTWNNWALENGLCPLQPFLVEMKHPRYYRCSYEYEEYDVDYYWEIVQRAPRTAKQVVRAWKMWMRTCARTRRAWRKATATHAQSVQPLIR